MVPGIRLVEEALEVRLVEEALETPLAEVDLEILQARVVPVLVLVRLPREPRPVQDREADRRSWSRNQEAGHHQDTVPLHQTRHLLPAHSRSTRRDPRWLP